MYGMEAFYVYKKSRKDRKIILGRLGPGPGI
jgi:hypothetical protein